jgi:hypothetical protein
MCRKLACGCLYIFGCNCTEGLVAVFTYLAVTVLEFHSSFLVVSTINGDGCNQTSEPLDI